MQTEQESNDEAIVYGKTAEHSPTATGFGEGDLLHDEDIDDFDYMRPAANEDKDAAMRSAVSDMAGSATAMDVPVQHSRGANSNSKKLVAPAFGSIVRGSDFIQGAEKFPKLDVETTFCAAVSPMNVMFRCNDNGEIIEDMRGDFINELLTMGVAECATGQTRKGSMGSCERGYAKYYSVTLSSTNLDLMSQRAIEDPDGPIARFLELRTALQACVELAPSCHMHTDFLRIDPDGQSPDSEHGDMALKDEEKATGRTRRISKSSSGSQPAFAVNRFRKKDQHKNGCLISMDQAVAKVPSSGAGSTYGAAAPAMGAVESAETAPAEAGAVKKVFYHHQPKPVEVAPTGDCDEHVWTLSYITDSIELDIAAQQMLVKVHLDMMARHKITAQMASTTWHFEPPLPEGIHTSCGRSSEESLKRMYAASALSNARNAENVGIALASIFPGGREAAAKAAHFGAGRTYANDAASEMLKLQQPKRRSKSNAASEVDWLVRGFTPIKKKLAQKLKGAAHDTMLGGVVAAAEIPDDQRAQMLMLARRNWGVMDSTKVGKRAGADGFAQAAGARHPRAAHLATLTTKAVSASTVAAVS